MAGGRPGPDRPGTAGRPCPPPQGTLARRARCPRHSRPGRPRTSLPFPRTAHRTPRWPTRPLRQCPRPHGGTSNLVQRHRHASPGACSHRDPLTATIATRQGCRVATTAGIRPRTASCAYQPEWAGQPCVTMVAAAPGTVDPARMTAELAKKRVSSYSRWGDVAVVTDSVAGTSASRTTTTLYDDAGRTTSVQITSTGDGATQIPAVTSDYHPASGQVTATHAGTATITREYDLWGRLYRYTDADGGVTTNEFDRYGNPTKVTDPTGNATFGYDRVAEPRGLLTSVTDSVAGTFTASYSADGQLTTLHSPGGMTRTDILDANLEPVTRSYTRDSDSTVIYSQSIASNTAGQTVSDTYTGGSKTYGYDRIGRLTSTKHVSPATAGCVTRAYSYDNRTNRTARKTYNPAGDGSCASTAGSPDAEDDHSYDAGGG